jgi:hypothetical protein
MSKIGREGRKERKKAGDNVQGRLILFERLSVAFWFMFCLHDCILGWILRMLMMYCVDNDILYIETCAWCNS